MIQFKNEIDRFVAITNHFWSLYRCNNIMLHGKVLKRLLCLCLWRCGFPSHCQTTRFVCGQENKALSRGWEWCVSYFRVSQDPNFVDMCISGIFFLENFFYRYILMDALLCDLNRKSQIDKMHRMVWIVKRLWKLPIESTYIIWVNWIKSCLNDELFSYEATLTLFRSIFQKRAILIKANK